MPWIARTALLAACALWAVSFVATKVALASTPPLTVVALRLLASALCFAVWAAASGHLAAGGWRHRWGALAGLSLLGTGLHYGTQTVGLQYTSASNASLYAVTAPVTIVILAALVLGERITAGKALGVALAIAGVLVVIGLPAVLAVELPSSVVGDGLVLFSIVLWGLFTVFGKRVTVEIGALRVTALVTIIGALWMAPVGWLETRIRHFALASISVEAWAAIAFLGVGCSFFATFLYFFALERAETQRVGVYLYTIPPMTAVVAALYLGETLSSGFVVGSALVFAGVFLTERG